MSTMLISFNGTRMNGNFMGDQLCALKTAYLFVQSEPSVDKVILSMSPKNEMNFLWERFIINPKGDGNVPPVEVVLDEFHPGDWSERHTAWNKWRAERKIGDLRFDHYRELYLRIHGAQRQTVLCGSERGLGKRNIYSYWYCGQEHRPDELPPSVDWFDDTLIFHPVRTSERDVYISPHCKTQGNMTFTFDYWSDVVHRLVDMGVSVTVGYDGPFCEDLLSSPLLNPLYQKHWGDHIQWMEQVCKHKMVACGNTGTGWLAAACGVPMITMEPHNSVMADHRYRECGLRNIVEVVDGHRLDEMHNDMGRVAEYTAQRIAEYVRKRVVLTTGCYDVLHAGHVRHLERSRALGTKLIVALNSDSSVRGLKGPERPINPQDQRKTVLEALRCVDEVRVFDGTDALPLIRELRPDVLTAGFGYSTETVIGRDLVESWGGSVVATCKGDAKNEPSSTKVVKRLKTAEVNEACRLGAMYSVNPIDKLKLMADEFLKVSHLDGDVADLGTYKGGSALTLRKLAPDKHLHCFDTWQGTPHDDPLCHHKKGEWKADLKECKKLVGDNDKTTYWYGVFPDIVKVWEKQMQPVGREFCFVYVDMDTEQATKDAIEFFLPRLVKGGKLFFDDYGWEPCAGVKKAVDEMFPTEECQRYGDLAGIPEKRVIQSLYSCVITWRAGK